jgi:hypothetical protein
MTSETGCGRGKLTALTALVGVQAHYGSPSGFVADLRASAGAVAWSDVDATAVLSGLPTAGISFFEGAVRFVLDLTTRVGYRDSNALYFLGFSTVVQGAPARGADMGAAFDPTVVIGFSLELGMEFTF